MRDPCSGGARLGPRRWMREFSLQLSPNSNRACWSPPTGDLRVPSVEAAAATGADLLRACPTVLICRSSGRWRTDRSSLFSSTPRSQPACESAPPWIGRHRERPDPGNRRVRSHEPWRQRRDLRLITTIMNPDEASSAACRAYAERWEFESSLDEIKTHQEATAAYCARNHGHVEQEIWHCFSLTTRSGT